MGSAVSSPSGVWGTSAVFVPQTQTRTGSKVAYVVSCVHRPLHPIPVWSEKNSWCSTIVWTLKFQQNGWIVILLGSVRKQLLWWLAGQTFNRYDCFVSYNVMSKMSHQQPRLQWRVSCMIMSVIWHKMEVHYWRTKEAEYMKRTS